MAHLGHHAGNIGHRRDEGELHDVAAGHIVGNGCALADELAGGIGVHRGGHDGNAGLLGNALDGAAHLGVVAQDEQGGFLLDGAQLALVAVGQDDDIALFHAVFQHFRGGGANADVPGGAHRVLAAHHHGGPQCFQNVLVAGAALGKDAGIEQVHVGGGDVLHRDQTFQLVVRCRHRQGVDLAVAHDLPRLAQAGGAGDAGHFAVVHIPDLGVDVRAHARGPDPEFLEHELGLLIHFACTAGFADQITGLVFQFCIGDGRADGIGVRIAMSDDNDLMGCFGHIVPPLGPGLPSMLISFTMVHSPLLHSAVHLRFILAQLPARVKRNKRAAVRLLAPGQGGVPCL